MCCLWSLGCVAVVSTLDTLPACEPVPWFITCFFLWMLCRGVIPCARFIYVCVVVSVCLWLCVGCRWDVLPVPVDWLPLSVVAGIVCLWPVDWWPWSLSVGW